MQTTLLAVIGPIQMLLGLLILSMPVLIIVLLVKTSNLTARIVMLEALTKKPANNVGDSLEKIERLNKMRESGALTPEEFEAEKKKLLK